MWNSNQLLRHAGCLIVAAGLAISLRPANAAVPDLGLKVPPDFEVTLYAGDDLATNIHTLTFDAKGRVVVAGPNYIKTLHDDDGDGKADRATLYSDKPASGAHGLCFDGDNLICTGDNGVWKLSDTDGDGKADKHEKWATLNHSEHGANGIARGPDGWFYVITGNDAGVTKAHITSERSPVKEPRCGALLRFSPDGKKCEVVAHGFRNPYGLDVDMYGHWFTVDSDNERDQYLPWYAPTRLLDIAQGAEHGWLLPGFQKSFNRPSYFFDSAVRLVEIGRGSPTGLVVYRHDAFPEYYREGVFSACWSLGRIYYMPLVRDGASYRTWVGPFAEATGSMGFNPTGLAVGPNGDLFVSVGGRGTRGSVYRIRYVNLWNLAANTTPSTRPWSRVLNALQPQAAWSRAKWAPGKWTEESKYYDDYVMAARDESRPLAESLRAIEVLAEFSPSTLKTAPGWQKPTSPEITSRLCWATARANDRDSFSKLVGYGDAESNKIHRASREGWQEFSHMIGRTEALHFSDSLNAARLDFDLRVRTAAFPTLGIVIRPGAANPKAPTLEPELIAQILTPPPSERIPSTIDRSETNMQRLVALRVLQLSLGDLQQLDNLPEVDSGYQCANVNRLTAKSRDELLAALIDIYPTRSPPLNTEVERTFAILRSDSLEAREWVIKQHANRGTVEENIHALIVLSLMPGKRTAAQTRRTADLLAGLHPKLHARKAIPSRNWPLRVGEAYAALVKLDPALPAALAESANFCTPDQSLFILQTEGAARVALARKLWQAALKTGDIDGWDASFLEAVTALPREEYIDKFRELFDEPGLRDAIAGILAAQPEPADRKRLGQALQSVQLNVVRNAASALAKLPAEYQPAEAASALKAVRQACLVPQETATREALTALLAYWSGQKFAIDEKKAKDLLTAYQPCFDWFQKQHPAESQHMQASATYDPAKWKTRLEKLDFDQGNVTRGKAVYEKQACHRCHTGQSRLGPDLTGAAARFSREDLFTAILDPAKDIAPPFRTKQIATRTGEVHTGLLVYDSPESTMLQTGPDTLVRITGVAPTEMRDSPTSLMPNGLLNDATDENLADLYAYLRSLTK